MEQTISDEKVWEHFLEEHPEILCPTPIKENTEKIIATLMKLHRIEPNSIQDATDGIEIDWEEDFYGMKFIIFHKGKCKVSYTYNEGGHLICINTKKPKEIISYLWDRSDTFPYLKISHTHNNTTMFIIRNGQVHEEQIDVGKKRRKNV